MDNVIVINATLVESGPKPGSTSDHWTYCSLAIAIGRASLARENEAGDNWGQEVHILHVNI